VTQQMQTIPQTNGEAPLPKRSAPKGLLPGSWVGRTLRVAYVDCYGSGQEATAALLDTYPFGVIVNLSGERTALAIFHLAVERGNEDLIKHYLEVRPEKAKLADKLMKAQESQERVKQATGWARSFPIRKPPELNSAVASRAGRSA
jgi:hypothetical protein